MKLRALTFRALRFRALKFPALKSAAVACALLIGAGSVPAFAGQPRTHLASSHLFGDVIVRPPRAIPNPKSPFGHSATMMPMPRARPVAAPASAPATARPEPPATGQAFPPAATFE
jgi:hypothetical protein